MTGSRRGTILIVDDLEGMRVMLFRQLTSLGHTVVLASDGAEALHTARAHQGGFDLVLTDVVMPGMNGTELATVLRSEFPTMPIVLMSGYAGSGVTRVGLGSAVIPVLRKPFEEQELRAIVQTALQLRTRRISRPVVRA